MGRLSVIALLVALGLGALCLFTKRSTASHAITRTEVPAIGPETVHELASAPPPAPPTPAARVPVPATSTAPAERDVRDPSLAAAVRASSSASFAGRVIRPDGAPVAGAEVAFECPEPFRSKLGPLARTQTGADGRFELPCAYAGAFRILATERVKDRVTTRAVREDVYPGRRDLEIVLQPALVHGRVVDDLARPDGGILAKASISVRGAQPDSRHSGSADRVGRFHLPLDGGTYWVSAMWREGEVNFSLAEPLFVELVPGAVQTLDLRLVACTEVWVSLLDADGHRVLADLEALDDRGHSFDALSRGQGVQTLMLVPPGHYELRARVDDRVFRRELTLPAGETQTSVEFRL